MEADIVDELYGAAFLPEKWSTVLARVPGALAKGLSLTAAAVEAGLQASTMRTYLSRIFRKTGTNQQSQLVVLLKSAHPF